MRVRQIDALRGIAALVVAGVFHIEAAVGVPTGLFKNLGPLTWLHQLGWTLVDLFFVISGFIFAHVYLEAGGQLKSGTTVRSFTVARVARLYPLHIVTLLAMALLSFFVAVPHADLRHFLLNLLFLQESGLNEGMSYNYSAWSLSVEALCYALFIAMARKGALFTFALPLILVGLMMSIGDGGITHIGRGLVGFFVGVLLWRWRDVRIPIIALLAVIIGALSLPYTLLKPGAVFSLTLWPALLLTSLRFRWSCDWLGDRSYSIYMVHAPAYALARLLVDGSQMPVEWQVATMSCALAATLLFADLSYRHLEQPARRIINGLATKPRKSASFASEYSIHPQ